MVCSLRKSASATKQTLISKHSKLSVPKCKECMDAVTCTQCGECYRPPLFIPGYGSVLLKTQGGRAAVALRKLLLCRVHPAQDVCCSSRGGYGHRQSGVLAVFQQPLQCWFARQP